MLLLWVYVLLSLVEPLTFLFLDLPHAELLPNQTNTCEGSSIIIMVNRNGLLLLSGRGGGKEYMDTLVDSCVSVHFIITNFSDI